MMRSTRTRKVLLIEPHPICRLALGRLLWSVGPELILAGEGAGFADAVRLGSRLEPDIVLLPIDHVADCSQIPAIVAVVPSARVVVLSSAVEGEIAFAALRAGAWAFVPKSADPEDILGTLRLVAGGEKVIHPSVTVSALIWAAEQEASWTERLSKWANLTQRERDILNLLASGMRARQIADQLFLSRRTVEWYLSSSYRKLGVHGRIDALREVQRLPLASIGS